MRAVRGQGPTHNVSQVASILARPHGTLDSNRQDHDAEEAFSVGLVVEPAEYTPFDEYVSEEIVNILAENSRQRVQGISHFRDVERLQSRLDEQARVTTVSLNRAKAEADEQARKALQKEVDEVSLVDCRDCFPGTTYDLEVLRIATEYVQMLRSR